MSSERETAIISLLENYGYLSVHDLSSLIHVSTPTIRRDLSQLEKEGIVVRNHGGAMLASNGLPRPFSYRSTDMREEKRQIAEAASSLLSDGSIIYLDTSTTVICLIDYLTANKNITVITNSLPAIQLLNNFGISVKCTGGDLNAESMGFIGHAAESYLAGVRTDFAFISTPAISLSGRISDYSEQETYLRKVALANTSHSVFLFEKNKLNRDATFTLCSFRDVDYLISNADIQSLFPNHTIKQRKYSGNIYIGKVV